MAKWMAVLLLLAVVAGALFYVWGYQPQQEALAATQAQLADRDQRLAEQDRQVAELKARIGDLEAVRDQLQQASTELKLQVDEKEKELEALRSTRPARAPPEKPAAPLAHPDPRPTGVHSAPSNASFDSGGARSRGGDRGGGAHRLRTGIGHRDAGEQPVGDPAAERAG